MKTSLKLSLIIILLSASFSAIAQKDINNESFTYKFLPNQRGAQIIYLGKNHSFSINVAGKVKEEQVEGKELNQSFFKVDTNTVQTSLVPLPQPIPVKMHLSNLTEAEKRETLEGYVNYEMDYFDKELKIKTTNVVKEWRTINSRLLLIWHFEFSTNTPNADKVFAAQVYVSTICFNQILDINMPVYKKDEIGGSKHKLINLASTLKIYGKRL